MVGTHATPRWKSSAAEKEGSLHIEPTPRLFRFFDSKVVKSGSSSSFMQSHAAFLVWESAKGPLLAFPKVDIQWKKEEGKGPGLEKSQKHTGSSKLASQYYDLINADGSRVEQVAWEYNEQTPLTSTCSSQHHMPSSSDIITLDTSKFASVWEEDEPMLGHVKNPYHRVDAVFTARRIQVYALSRTSSNVLIADTVNSNTTTGQAMAVFETGLPTRWYLPANAFRIDGDGQATMQPLPACQLQDYPKGGLETVCPYKGVARYHNITLPDGEVLENVAWAYPEAIPALDLRGLVALWTPGNDRFKLVVDGQEVKT